MRVITVGCGRKKQLLGWVPFGISLNDNINYYYYNNCDLSLLLSLLLSSLAVLLLLLSLILSLLFKTLSKLYFQSLLTSSES